MDNFPRHIALIPDGNRRWAREKGLPTFEGHRRGFERVRELTQKVGDLGIETFTVWAFSTENWSREKKEVDYLMGIYEKWIEENLSKALKDQIRIIHIGRKDRIRESLRKKLGEAEEKTKAFSRQYFVAALDYGGRDEIVRAIEKGRQKEQELNEETLEKFLDTKVLPYPNPDLIIRTSGEQRTSGFMMWQSAYSEYLFVEKYLPDFTAHDLEKCVREYSDRQRRFGK